MEIIWAKKILLYVNSQFCHKNTTDSETAVTNQKNTTDSETEVTNQKNTTDSSNKPEQHNGQQSQTRRTQRTAVTNQKNTTDSETAVTNQKNTTDSETAVTNQAFAYILKEMLTPNWKLTPKFQLLPNKQCRVS